MKTLLATGAALALVLAAPAMAETITFTLDGSFNGILQGAGSFEPTTLDGTMIGIGDLANAVDGSVPLFSLTLVAAGFTGTVDGARFTVEPATGIARFDGPFDDGPSFGGQALSGYTGRTSIGPVALSGFSIGSLSFVSGDQSTIFNFTDFATPATFAAEVMEPPAPDVPEPATWATMLLGFGLVGTAARRRKAATA